MINVNQYEDLQNEVIEAMSEWFHVFYAPNADRIFLMAINPEYVSGKMLICYLRTYQEKGDIFDRGVYLGPL